MTAASDRSKAQVLYILKEVGDIVDPSGLATTKLHNAFKERGIPVSSGYVSTAARALGEEGLIAREVEGTRTLSLKLFSVGEYVDPFTPEGERLYGSPQTRAAYAPRQSSVERLLGDIRRLSISERLMLVGMIIDEAAGEVEEREQKIKQVLSAL